MRGNGLVEKLFTKDMWVIYRWKTKSSKAYAKHDCQNHGPLTGPVFETTYCWKCGLPTPDGINALIKLFNYGLSTKRTR